MRKHDYVLYLFSAVALLIVALPIFGLLASVNWETFFNLITSTEALLALRVSLIASTIAAVFSIIFGVPLAYVLARRSNGILNFLRPLVIAPLILPPTVAGLALLIIFGRNSPIGVFLENNFQINIPFTTIAVIIVGIFVGMPFLILIMESSFKQLPIELDEAANDLGATAAGVFWKITLPQVKLALTTGFMLAWARALGEFGATLAFAGSLPGVTRTLPMQVYVAMETNLDLAKSISALMIFIALFIMWLTRQNVKKVLLVRF